MKGIALVLCAWLVGSGAALADAPKPWAASVSEADQELALSIYRVGNGEFEESRYAQALAKYRDAIVHWDHPAIRFNMVVCLVNLDQPLEAYEDLELALKFGDAPLGADVYAQGLTYRKLLLGQLAKLHVVSKEPGAEVALDGKKLFTSPGEITQLVAPGDHQLVATKPNYLTMTMPLVLVPGKVTIGEVKMVELKAATKLVRRWPAWKPWVVVGTGAAIALIGAPFELQAATNYAAYDREFATSCANGCGGIGQAALPASLVDVARTARVENVTALSLFAIGGATLVAGLVGVFINQPRATISEERDLRVVPTVNAGTASVVIDGRF